MSAETKSTKWKGYTVEISPDFTIDDIHKIREARYNYAMTLPENERLDYYNSLGGEVREELKKRRANHAK